MLIVEGRRFIAASFDSEAELEKVVLDNAEYIFGPGSIYFPKALIKTRDGFGTIPDGFVIDLPSRQWFIVEAELSKHSVWSHIAPQVAKQLIASTNPTTKQLLVNLIVEQLQADEALLERFEDENIPQINIRHVLGEIIDKKPIIGMPIDAVSADLREWATTLRVNVKLWIVRKHVEFGKPDVVMYEIPEEYKPVLETDDGGEDEEPSGPTRYEVTISDLIDAGLIHAGEELQMPYKPRNGQPTTYKGIVQASGDIELLGQTFSSPSYAALYGIQDAGSNRRTVNGWISWRSSSGKLLSDLREAYLTHHANSEVSTD